MSAAAEDAEDAADDDSLAAGDFADWITAMNGAIRGEHDAAVPCGPCTACCTSSQFIHVAPDETDTLARISPALLFPAPGLPRGNVLMGYDQDGRCPMLVDSTCTIYEHRPRTCRTYDCRVFVAADVALDDASDKPAIAGQARRWRFTYDATGEVAQAAVRAAAAFVRSRRDELPATLIPVNSAQLAVAGIHLHQRFLTGEDPPSLADVSVELSRLRGRA